MKLRPVAERDAIVRELTETTTYVDPTTGDPYEPVEPSELDPETSHIHPPKGTS